MPAPPLSEDVLRQTVEALQKYGTETEAAKALGMSRSTFQTRVRVAASRGFAPGHFNNGVAPGYVMGKVTIQRGPTGVERVWERQAPDREAMREAMLAVIEGLKADLPKAEAVAPPGLVNADLCNLYTFTDYHLGMYAWRNEGGADWDLAIAERILLGAMRAMVAVPARVIRASRAEDQSRTRASRNEDRLCRSPRLTYGKPGTCPAA